MPFIDAPSLLAAACGRWHDVLTAAGMPASVLDGRGHPCPRCGGRDRFATFPDFDLRGAVHCRHCFTRGCPVSPGDGIATLRWWLGLEYPQALEFLAGVLGISVERCSNASLPVSSGALRPANEMSAPRHRKPVSQGALSPNQIEQHTQFAKAAFERIDDELRNQLAGAMGVSVAALKALRVGITADHAASTWPMRDASYNVIGVSIRGLPWTEHSSRRWSRRGSQSGLFLPRPESAAKRWLCVVEGASDTAAAWDAGLWAVGRAGCSASSHFVERFVHTMQPARLTVIADHDDPGIRGAKRLARMLSADLPRSLSAVEVIWPEASGHDLRDWISNGADRESICEQPANARFTPPQQLQLKLR